MKSIFLFIKRFSLFVVLAVLQFFLSGNSKHQKNIPNQVSEERRWTGTITLEQRYSGITGTSERHVTVSFNSAWPTLHRDGVTTTDLNFTDDKGTGSETFHAEARIEGKLIGTSDHQGSGQTELHIVDMDDESYYIHAIGPSCTGTDIDLINGITTTVEPYNTDITITERLGITRDILSGAKTETADMGGGAGTVTTTITWHLVRSTDIIDEPCTACGSVIGIENQSLGQAIAITGTPFTLNYRSDRVAVNNNSVGLGLVGWSLNIHHSFWGQRLYLGDGRQRTLRDNVGNIKPVVNEIPSVVPGNGYLIASGDGGEVYSFDKSGRHLRTFDALTGTLIYQFEYNETSKLRAVVDAYGLTTIIERNTNGDPTAIVSPYLPRTELVSDNHQHLKRITGPAGEKTLFEYSKTGLLTKMVDPRGLSHTYQYDDAGRLNKDDDPAGGYSTLARTSITNGHAVALNTALRRSANYSVINQPDGIRKSVITFPDGSKNTLTTWTDGRMKVEFGDGTIRTNDKALDPRGGEQSPSTQTTTIETPGGLKAKKTHKRLITQSDPVNPLSLTKLTDSWSINGRISISEYITSSRTLSEKSPLGRTITTTFNNSGQVSKISIAGVAPVSFSYDAKGRLVTVEQGADTEIRRYEYKYDNRGNIASIVDPIMRTSTFEYDAADRTTLANLPGDRVLSYRYDEVGNVTTIIPPGKTKHTFEYNAINLVTKYNPPAADANVASTSFEYDPDRQLSQIIRPGGQTMKMLYDPGGCACGKLNEAVQPRGTSSYAYYPKTGRLKSITAPGGVTLTFAYDGALLTTESWAGPVTGSMTRNYNANFEIVSDKVSGGPPIEYKYDADGLLIQTGELFLTRSSSNTLITGTKLGSLSESFTVNVFGELMKSRATFNNLPLLEVQYTRDKLGRITRRSETIEGITTTYEYAYDLAGRLSTVIRDGNRNTVYKYDNNYNRISLESPPGTISAVYDNQDRLIEYGVHKFTYTTAGELLTKTIGIAVTNYEYDLLGNLLRVILPNKSVIDYIIDGRSRRIGRKVNGMPDKGYLYQDGLLISAELDGKGNVVSRFVYGSRPNIPDYMIKGGVVFRIIADHLGSPRLIADIKTGKVVQRIDYDEFGNILIDTNPGFQPFGFAGGLYDPITKLTRFGLRDYDAETGRWTAKDPLLFQGEDTNPYSYVRSDPINARDAVGLQSGGSAGVSNFGLSLTGPLVEGAFREMAFQAAMAGFIVTGKNEKSGHNVGSKHYQGNAIDLRCWDKSDKEIEDFIEFMRSQGYTVRDERVRPPGQKEWSGPHLHIEVPTPKPPPKPTPRPRPIQSGVCALPR